MKIGIITDIHENVELLREALKLAERYKCDELTCLGDIVGFDTRFYRHSMKRSAKGCIELIRSNCRWVSVGNHDLFAAGKHPAYSNGFEYPESWFKMTAEERIIASNGKVWSYACDDANDLDEVCIEYLRSLPEYFIIPFNESLCIFSHYIFPDFTGSTTRYIERNRHLCEAWKFMDLHEIRYSFSGHSHNNFTGFAYRNSASFLKAIHSIPDNSFNLGNEMVIIVLPALSGEKGKSGFSIIDSDSMKLDFILTGNA
jgi:predicted phosphodiesterase